MPFNITSTYQVLEVIITQLSSCFLSVIIAKLQAEHVMY